MEMNKKTNANFFSEVDGEKWHIFAAWKTPDNDIAYYVGEIVRDGCRFERTFVSEMIK